MCTPQDQREIPTSPGLQQILALNLMAGLLWSFQYLQKKRRKVVSIALNPFEILTMDVDFAVFMVIEFFAVQGCLEL